MNNINDFIIDYLNDINHPQSMESQIRFYQSLVLYEAIGHACNKGEYNVNGKVYKNRHFDRRKKTSLIALKEELFRRMNAIEIAKSFDEVYNIVQEEGKKIKDIGALTIYDIAVRVGASINVLPSKLYLQAGAVIGACKLGIIANIKNLVIDVEAMNIKYPALKKLNTYQVENFLCVYKDKFKDESNGRFTRLISKRIKKNNLIRQKEYKRFC